MIFAKDYAEQIEKTCRQIGSSALSLMEQHKQTKTLEISIKEKSSQILVLEKEKQDLIEQIDNLKISNDFELNELKKEVVK